MVRPVVPVGPVNSPTLSPSFYFTGNTAASWLDDACRALWLQAQGVSFGPSLLFHAGRLQLCPTLCDPMVACQAPLSMGFSRQEYWRGLPCPSPGFLPDPGIRPACLMSDLHWQTGSLPLVPPGKPSIQSCWPLKLSLT